MQWVRQTFQFENQIKLITCQVRNTNTLQKNKKSNQSPQHNTQQYPVITVTQRTRKM